MWPFDGKKKKALYEEIEGIIDLNTVVVKMLSDTFGLVLYGSARSGVDEYYRKRQGEWVDYENDTINLRKMKEILRGSQRILLDNYNQYTMLAGLPGKTERVDIVKSMLETHRWLIAPTIGQPVKIMTEVMQQFISDEQSQRFEQIDDDRLKDTNTRTTFKNGPFGWEVKSGMSADYSIVGMTFTPAEAHLLSRTLNEVEAEISSRALKLKILKLTEDYSEDLKDNNK